MTVRWEKSRYTGWDGYPGQVKVRLFSITYRTARSGPAWNLSTELPGMIGRRAADDDEQRLRVIAEGWLAEFIETITGPVVTAGADADVCAGSGHDWTSKPRRCPTCGAAQTTLSGGHVTRYVPNHPAAA